MKKIYIIDEDELLELYNNVLNFIKQCNSYFIVISRSAVVARSFMKHFDYSVNDVVYLTDDFETDLYFKENLTKKIDVKDK